MDATVTTMFFAAWLMTLGGLLLENRGLKRRLGQEIQRNDLLRQELFDTREAGRRSFAAGVALQNQEVRDLKQQIALQNREINALHLEVLDARKDRAHSIPTDRLKRLILLCHPDKHDNSKVAEETTKWLMTQK